MKLNLGHIYHRIFGYCFLLSTALIPPMANWCLVPIGAPEVLFRGSFHRIHKIYNISGWALFFEFQSIHSSQQFI